MTFCVDGVLSKRDIYQHLFICILYICINGILNAFSYTSVVFVALTFNIDNYDI